LLVKSHNCSLTACCPVTCKVLHYFLTIPRAICFNENQCRKDFIEVNCKGCNDFLNLFWHRFLEIWNLLKLFLVNSTDSTHEPIVSVPKGHIGVREHGIIDEVLDAFDVWMWVS